MRVTGDRRVRSFFPVFLVLTSLLLAACANPFIQQIVNPRTVSFYTNTNGEIKIDDQIIFRGYRVARPQPPARFGYDFVYWYRDIHYFEQRWNFSYLPGGDMTLYARWEERELDTVDVSIRIDIAAITDGSPVLDFDTVLSRNGLGGLPIRVRLYVNPADFDAGSISWRIAGTDIVVNSYEFTLDAADERYNALGGHLLALRVMVNGVLFQSNIRFTIEE